MTGNVLDIPLAEYDPEIAGAINHELNRQQQTLEMIASENFTPVSVMQAQVERLAREHRPKLIIAGWSAYRLHEVGITVNRNAVPFDPRPPMVTSGLRLGTPALASRSFGIADFAAVADIIVQTLTSDFTEGRRDPLRGRVQMLAASHPLYPGL